MPEMSRSVMGERPAAGDRTVQFGDIADGAGIEVVA
jgi:hypothetical protein